VSKPVPGTRNRVNTRERLLDAALDVFSERGLGGTTVEQVCDRAGFTRGAFYSNFSSVQELFLASCERSMSDAVQRMNVAFVAEPLRPPHGSAAAVDVIVDRMLESLRSDRRTWVLLTEFRLYALRNADAANALRAVKAAQRHELAGLATATLQACGLRSTVSIDEFVDALSTVYEGALLESLLDADPLAHELRCRRILPAVMRSLTEEI
jgi:AcrR family transcriptional regulator